MEAVFLAVVLLVVLVALVIWMNTDDRPDPDYDPEDFPDYVRSFLQSDWNCAHCGMSVSDFKPNGTPPYRTVELKCHGCARREVDRADRGDMAPTEAQHAPHFGISYACIDYEDRKAIAYLETRREIADGLEGLE